MLYRKTPPKKRPLLQKAAVVIAYMDMTRKLEVLKMVKQYYICR
jgi:hypothetical protein